MRRVRPGLAALSGGLLLLALALVSCAGGGKQNPADTVVPPSPSAPSFQAVDMETGETVTVPDAYRGRALALLFFSPG